MGDFLRLPLLSFDDVATARQLTGDVARVSGMSSLDQTKLATVVSGMVRRTFASSSHGEVVFSIDATDASDSAGQHGLSLLVTVFDASTDAVASPTVSSGGTTSGGPRTHLDNGNLRLLIGDHGHGTAPGGANYVCAAVRLSEAAAADPTLLRRLGAVRPNGTAPEADADPVVHHSPGELRERLGNASSGDLRQRLGTARPMETPPPEKVTAVPSGDLHVVVARQAAEIERITALVKRAHEDRLAANAELEMTNRGVLELVAELSSTNEMLVAKGTEMRQLAGQQSALVELGHRAVASRDLALFAVGLVGVLRRVLGIQGVAVLQFTPAGSALEVFASEGCSPEQPETFGLTGAQAESLRRSESTVCDPDVDVSDIFLDVPGGARSCAVVAVHTPAGPWGVLVACDPVPGRITATAITFLEAAVSLFAFSIVREISEETTRHAASHDALTGLPNRSQLLDDLARMLAEATDAPDTPDTPGGQAVAHNDAEESGLAVIFIDIDGFKQVNDTLGHATGDLVLIAAAERLQALARPDYVLARLGGDEFVVLCDRGAPAAPVIAARLLSAFDEPFPVEGSDVFLSASAGIALAESGATPQLLLADADIAMYRAKQTPGSVTVCFHPDMRAQAQSQSLLHNELRRARQRGQLRAVYQPIVDMRDGQVRGVEALLRWRHPQLGDVPADVVVAAAEQIGTAWDLTCWFTREAAVAVSGWNSSNPAHAPLRLAVNVSAVLLEDPGRVAEFAAGVTDAGLPLALLDVELTETAFANPTAGVLSSIAQLRRMGARLALDDFGTGHSSLVALTDLPLDVLKIDPSFILPGDRGAESTLGSAMTFIARGRTMETVAEGIESEGQLATLIAAGCELGQGLLFSSPLEAEQLTELAPSEVEFAEVVRQASKKASLRKRMQVQVQGPRV